MTDIKVKLWVMLIDGGRKTIDDVPDELKEAVKTALGADPDR